MADQTYAYPIWDFWSRMRWGGVVYHDGKEYYPCVVTDRKKRKKTYRLRLRPTGEVGSGPYFCCSSDTVGDNEVIDRSRHLVVSGSYSESSLPYYRMVGAFTCGTKCTVRVASESGSSQTGYHAWIYIVEFLYEGQRNGQDGFWFRSQSYHNDIPAWTGDLSGMTADLESRAEADYRLKPDAFKVWKQREPRNFGPVVSTQVGDGNFHFRYNELQAFQWYNETEVLTNPLRDLAYTAYLDALDNVPRATCNTVDTVRTLLQDVIGMLNGKKVIGLPSSLADAWLAYRYSYTTTKLDIREYRSVVNRLLAIDTSKLRVDGFATRGEISCHVSFDLWWHDIFPPTLAGWLNTYGFSLSLLNTWDMIPYSFIADWFLPIGDWLEQLDREERALSLPPHNGWTSFSSSYNGQCLYMRIPGVQNRGNAYLHVSQPSTRVQIMRCADALAIFL